MLYELAEREFGTNVTRDVLKQNPTWVCKWSAADIAHAVFPGEPYFMLALTNAWMGMPGRELDKDICMKVSDLNLPVPLTAR